MALLNLAQNYIFVRTAERPVNRDLLAADTIPENTPSPTPTPGESEAPPASRGESPSNPAVQAPTQAGSASAS